MVVSSRRKIGSIGTGTAGIDIAPSDARRANRPRATNDGSATACCSDVTTETQTSRPAKRCCHSCAVAELDSRCHCRDHADRVASVIALFGG